MSACAALASGWVAIAEAIGACSIVPLRRGRVANRTPAERVEVIVKLRRLRMTAAEIAETLAMPLSTVSGILTRLGIGRLGYRSAVHALCCRTLGIRHPRTRPYRPQTHGKAERFIRTLPASWAYGAIYQSSRERTAALDGWLWHYNHRRRHSALGHQPPVSRTNLANVTQCVSSRIRRMPRRPVSLRARPPVRGRSAGRGRFPRPWPLPGFPQRARPRARCER